MGTKWFKQNGYKLNHNQKQQNLCVVREFAKEILKENSKFHHVISGVRMPLKFQLIKFKDWQ